MLVSIFTMLTCKCSVHIHKRKAHTHHTCICTHRVSQHSMPYCVILMGDLSNDISFAAERKLNHAVSGPDYDFEMYLS